MKFLKIAGISFVSLIVILYLTVLFAVPNVVNLNNFKSDIQKMLKEQAGLNMDFTDAKITVTPLLSAGIKADNINIMFPDNSSLFNAESVIGRISLPQLILKNINVTKAEITNPKINIDITDGKEYKLVKHFEQLGSIQEKQTTQEQTKTETNDLFDLSSIKINVPEIKILNYSLFINDIKTSDYLKLRGDELLLSYKDGKTASVKTIAELFVNENKNITANIDVDTFLPKTEQKSDNSEIKTETSQNIQFINPVAVYKAYNLKTNIDTKLKIRQKDNKIVSKGYLNIDNLSLMLSGLQLPESKIHIKTDKTNVSADTELYITNNEKLSLKASGDYGNNPSADMKIKSDEIHAANVLTLVKAALDSANIKNDIDLIKGSGSFLADTEFKTDLKNLTSNGSITFKDVDIRNSKKNSRIAKINSIISLDDSILKFVNTTVEIFDTLFNINGTINQKSFADIDIIMQKMPLSKVFELFLPKEINNTYNVNSGTVNLSANISGELNSLSGKAKMSLNNLSLKDTVNGINYLNNLLTADITSDFKTFKGSVNNSDFKLSMEGIKVNCDKFSMEVGDKNIIINPAVLSINNSTNINLKGTVNNYLNNPVFDITADGGIKTSDIKQFLGNDISMYIKEKGTLPINANISGDNKTQTVSASISADADNYITPIDISEILNKNTFVNAVVEIKDNRLTLKNTGFFSKEGSNNKEIAGVDGTISKLNTKNPIINTLKIKIPNDLNMSLSVFPQSKLLAKGDVVISGELNNPKIRGDFNISNMSIPELYLTGEKATAKFEDKNFDLELKKINANGSDFNIVMNADLTPSKYFTIKTLNIISDLTDADKVMKVSDALAKYTTPSSSNSSQKSSSQNSSASDIPVIIKDGSIDIKELKSGTMTFTETTGKISMIKNVFYIKNLITSGFKGKIKGDVSMNLITSEINANLKGNGLDVSQTLLEAAAMKDTLTGTMDFDADLSLKGSTYEEQVKTLKGNVDFSMKDGSLGPLGKIENLISADNLSSSSALKTLINTTLSSTVDTSKFNTLNGHLSFDKGITQINPITSSGDYMSTYIFGNFDILKNNADLKLRGRLGSKVTESMGQLALLNPVNVVKSSSNMNMVLGSLLLTMCEQVTSDELSQIPAITKESSDENTAKFQVVIRGDAAKPLKLVRSFKWLATETQIKDAKSYLGTLSVISVPKDVKEVKQQAKDILKSLTSEGTSQINQQGKEVVNAVKSLLNNSASTENSFAGSENSSEPSSSNSGAVSIKDQLKQLKTSTLKQLAEQAKQAVSENNSNSDSQ